MNPVGGLRLTLISPSPFTPYSGMLPGLLAGHYDFAETHIDLQRFCQVAGVRFFADTVDALDPARRVLTCRKRGSVSYDYLSIDIGSQPDLDSVPGAREYATPVKPVAGLWDRWQELHASDLSARQIAVVGGGAGSVEVALAMAHRLRAQRPRITLYCGSARLLEGYSRGARRAAEVACSRLGVAVHCDRRVALVRPGELVFSAGDTAGFDTLIWSTGAAAADWIAQSGLAVDERGFMVVKDTLQSESFAEVFGAGDIATQRHNPRPKAGVYAVRQGPVLAANLAAVVSGGRLREHRPQQRFLSLLSLGEKRAVAERRGISASGAWAWTWKDRIDRAFMDRFSGLSADAMPTHSPTLHVHAPDTAALNAQAPCGGCGAKVGENVLAAVLDQLHAAYPECVAAPEERDDAAPVPIEGSLVQSVDLLRALVDDPWRMGRIAAQHALSDLYASGATPASAQAVITLPFAASTLLRRDLQAVLAGAVSVLSEARCRLIGGHSMQGPELQIGFAVNGVLSSGAALTRRGARVGDGLILTSFLGSGALFAAHMLGRADGRDVDSALTVMERGNASASEVARSVGATALTDITGFGLAGHVLPMLDATTSARIDLHALPVLSGALHALRAGVRSTMHGANCEAALGQVALGRVESEREALLYDPQTGGGLLMAMPADRADAALMELNRQDVAAVRIGEFVASAAGGESVTDGHAILTRP